MIDEQSIIQAAEDFGSRPLDLLINVAGIFQLWDEKPFTEQSSEDLLRHFRVNVIVSVPRPMRLNISWQSADPPPVGSVPNVQGILACVDSCGCSQDY